MKFLLKVVLVALLTYLTALFLPWWTAVICAFFVNIIIRSGSLNSFLSGFLGVGLCWMIAAWILFSSNEAALVTRLAPLFKANEGVVLVVYTTVLGAIEGGLGGLCGSYFLKIFGSNQTSKGYY